MTLAHVLSLDVEDYFQVLNLRKQCPKDSWDQIELRCAAPTRLFLDLLDEYDAKASFFCLGWIAERLPDLIGEIAARGHEVASHGYDHECLPDLGPDGFREDLRRTAAILEPLSGQRPKSFRACTWSITDKTPWALPILAEEGYRRDSSIHPVPHPEYGMPKAPLFAHELEPLSGKKLFELPPLVVERFGKRLALGGGGYLRLFPVRWIHKALRHRERIGEPSCIYLHPWELDPGQPRMGAGGLKGFRHYVGLAKTERKLRFLLERHAFTTMEKVEAAWRQRPPGAQSKQRSE
ncbi:MAG: polysaccharide deacetylase family protein [Planctomycetota bacterium]|nr:MAG: polysaccharide deacetylase family protein [Planctomycetota bacterium]